MMSQLKYVFIFILFKIFQVTDKWQIVPEGFVLPTGCKIQMDMKTGQRMAMVSSKRR